MIRAVVLVWEAKMCPVADILMVHENCVANFFMGRIDFVTLFTDAQCYGT